MFENGLMVLIDDYEEGLRIQSVVICHQKAGLLAIGRADKALCQDMLDYLQRFRKHDRGGT